MLNLGTVGDEWLEDELATMPVRIDHIGPVEYNEKNRFLPEGLSPRPGFIRYDLFPFLRELIECFDPHSPVREVNLMKGVQTGYTTLLESILFYGVGYLKTEPFMYITADSDLAKLRVDNNIIPMLNESDMGHLIRSADEGNSRKTGKTKDYLQWQGGGFMVFNGAQNAAKMRQTSVSFMLKDELDGWPRSVGKDGNSDSLTDARLSTYWEVRKILRGSTPLTEPSMINEAFLRGDQREYRILCRGCSFPQSLRMTHEDGGGFKWDLESDKTLILESVRYECCNCGRAHYDADKEVIFATEHGAHWHPTAKPKEEQIRSYHLPAWYSPHGFRPWSKGVSDFLAAYDPVAKQTISADKYQEFRNNTLGRTFTIQGSKVQLESVSMHRRTQYKFGEVPNKLAAQYSGSKIIFLTCEVDVHKNNLAVSVFGWTRDAISYLIDYWRFETGKESEDCTEISCSVWARVTDLIEDKRYTSGDTTYRISMTLIDAGYANDTVNKFCSKYASGVYPILGRDRASKNQKIQEFSEFTTQIGTTGYKINVDHYKDRLGPVLRREWMEEAGPQKPWHFNVPVDATTKQLRELTVEVRRKDRDSKGNTFYYWYRPGNARNELWDLLVYAHASVEIWAWLVCIQHFELKTVDWAKFWEYCAEGAQDDLFGRVVASPST